MKIKRKKGIVAHEGSDDEEPISYCPRCLKSGVREVLQHRIYLPDEPYREGDEENWRQCHRCGKIVPIYETKRESRVKDSIDTSDNPFAVGKSIVGLGNKRKRNREREKRLELIDSYEYEPDIQDVLRRGGTVINHDDLGKNDLRSFDSMEEGMQPEKRRNLRSIEDLE